MHIRRTYRAVLAAFAIGAVLSGCEPAGAPAVQPYTLLKQTGWAGGFTATFKSPALSKPSPQWRTAFNGFGGNDLILEVRPKDYADLDAFRACEVEISITDADGKVIGTWSGPLAKDWTESEGGEGSRFHQHRNLRHINLSRHRLYFLMLRVHSPDGAYEGRETLVYIRTPYM